MAGLQQGLAMAVGLLSGEALGSVDRRDGRWDCTLIHTLSRETDEQTGLARQDLPCSD